MKLKNLEKKVETGRRYKALRILKGWKQSDVANLLKVSQAYISDFESGKKQGPRITRLLDNLYYDKAVNE